MTRRSLMDLTPGARPAASDDAEDVQEAADAVRYGIRAFPTDDRWEKTQLLDDACDLYEVSGRSVVRALRTPAPAVEQRTGCLPNEGTRDPSMTPQQRAEIDGAAMELDAYVAMGMLGPPADFEPPSVDGYVLACAWNVSSANIVMRRGGSDD